MSADTAPAAMPGEEEIARLIDPSAWDRYLPHLDRAGAQEKAREKARAILDLFAPILAEKERRIAEWQAEVGREGDRYKDEINDLNAECDRLHSRALAAEAALAAERERCAKIAEQFAEAHAQFPALPHAGRAIAAAIRG